MDNKLKEQLQDVIQKHMPGLVAGELKQFVEQATDAIKVNERLYRDVARLQQELKEKSVQLNGYGTREERIVSKEAELNAKEEALKEKENKLEVETYKFKNEQLLERLKDSKEFMLMLAKNPRVIEYMASNHLEPVPVSDMYNNTRIEHMHVGKKGVKEIVETKGINIEDTGAPEE